jgi:Phage replication protein CRI
MPSKHEYIAECLMIDTMGLRVENVPHLLLPKPFGPLSDDPTATTNSGWAKGNLKSESGKHRSLRVQTLKATGQLIVEGSNSTQYVDHNIVSSGDAVMTAFSMLDAVRRQYPMNLDNAFRPREFMRGRDIEVTRIDTPVMLAIPPELRLGAVINALGFAGLRAGVGTSVYPDETVYFDQHAQLESLKCYDKGVEIRKRRRNCSLPDNENSATLKKLTDSTLRLEGVFRLKRLSNLFGRNVVTPAMLSPKVLADMFLHLLNKYQLKDSLRCLLSNDELLNIDLPYRMTVALWQSGVDLRTIFGSDEKRLKSHQRMIRKRYDINILNPSPAELGASVELGEILCVENFVPIPASIRADRTIFYERNMHQEFQRNNKQNGFSGISAIYIDPYSDEEAIAAYRPWSTT